MLRYGALRSALVLILFLTGCDRMWPAPSAPQPLPSPTDSWSLSLTQSGGIAGVSLKVQVSSDGQLSAEDHRSGRTVRQTLPPETVAHLAAIYSSGLLLTPQPRNSGCADCFIYNLEMSSGGRVVHIVADDTTMDSSGAGELIRLLRLLRDNALKSQP